MPASNKRPGEDLEGPAVPVHEAAGRLFENVGQVGGVRKKLAASSRTGQACDRCKIRKIRCDARPGGCSPCAQNNTECKTTDRITGRATARGHAEYVESENGSLRMYMLELQQQLRDNGVEPKAPPNMSETFAPFQPYYDQSGRPQGSWGDLSSSGVAPGSSQNERHNSQGSLLPDFRAGCIGDNYVGVSSANPLLSPIEGTQLSLFGMKLDLAEFLPPEDDPMSDPLSYQTFLKYAFNQTNQVYKPPLPNYANCTTLAEWFFKTVQPFIPIVHKPDYMKLLSRVHYGHQQMNAAETVIVHMVITIMTFQGALRNGDDQSRQDALHRFHYCLTFVPELISGHQLQDIQALAIICSFLRSQPRLGAAWMFTNGVLGLAIELGLHRSANAWQGDAAERDPHVIELRKRIFWSLLLIHVNLSGKLGRPMPLRMEDFDIEIPEMVADNLPGEANLSKWAKCSFRAAIPGMKMVKILMQTYATVYSIRPNNEPYEVSMRNLEKELKVWRSQLAPAFADEKQISGEDRIPAYYLQTTEQAIRLLLHHPSLSQNMSPQLTASNLDNCLDASTKILEISERLKALNSLDTTWYLATDYLAAIFTTLFACNERQSQMTSQDLQQLQRDMDRWLEVMGDVGKLLGSGPRLRDTLRSVYIEPSIAQITRSLAARTASAGLASAESSASPVEQPQHQQIFQNTNGFNNPFENPNAEAANETQQPYAMNSRASGHAQTPAAYSAGGQYYADTQPAQMQSYMGAFDTSYTAEDMKPNIGTPMHAHNVITLPQAPHPPTSQQAHHTPQITPQQAPAGFIAAFQPQTPQSGFHPPPNPNMQLQHSGQAAWRHYADTVIPNMSSQDYMTSANALMALQGDKSHAGMDMSAAAGVASMGGMHMAPDGQQPWPLIYNSGDGQ